MSDRSSDRRDHTRQGIALLHEDVPPDPVPDPVEWYQLFDADDNTVQGPHTLQEMEEEIDDISRRGGSGGLHHVEVRCFEGLPPKWEKWERRERWPELDDDLLEHRAVDMHDHLADYLYELKVLDETISDPLTVNRTREMIVELGLHREASANVWVRRCKPSWGDWQPIGRPPAWCLRAGSYALLVLVLVFLFSWWWCVGDPRCVGDPPPVDCSGYWSACGAECTQEWIVVVNASGTGQPCEY
eukprot:COSAG02_NODE_18972_length_907_cov_1.233911_1_plen_242_part_01